jgi:hypothetical protein
MFANQTHVKRFLLCVCSIPAVSCIFHRVEVKQVLPRDAVAVTSPVKAHLKDGSTVVYANGVTVAGSTLQGMGVRYDLALANPVGVASVPLDSVIGMESFQTRVNVGPTVAANTLIGAGAFVGTVALFKAIFGSCPTVYSDNGAVDEAELFSNSIAPLFEARDVDRLRAKPDAKGVLRLEVRNEALETHYINHLQLLEVTHDGDEFVLPDARDHPVVVRGIRTPADTISRSGRSLSATLGAADGVFYQTDPARIEGAAADDLNDWIDLTAAVPEGAASTTLVFRLRNSLLETTLLYDVMLAPAGARSIDWLGAGHTSTAVQMGLWYQRRFGLHVSVFRDGAYREVARLADPGPIFWHDVAAVIPARPGETSLRVRLSFLADHFRIDRIGVASAERPAEPRAVPISEVTASGGHLDSTAREALSAPDDRYLQTGPGDRFFLAFNVGPAPPGESRTFLLSSQGYYTEWIRGTWIQFASAKEPFVPSDQALLTGMRAWAAKRQSFEERFVRERVLVH